MGADRIVKRRTFQEQLDAIYAALKTYPMHTCMELSRASGIDYYLIQKRMTVLEGRNLAQRRGKRVCMYSTTGIPVQVWDVK